MSVKVLLTIDEFERLVPPDGVRYELDEGELVEMTFPNFRHNEIAGNVYYILRLYLRENPVGKVYPSDCGFQLARNPDTLRGPDVAYFRMERAASVDPASARYTGAPDLVVEVISPSDTSRGINRKIYQYLKAGAEVVWIVYPEEREVHVFPQSGLMQILSEDEALDAPGLLPGFSTPVRALFE